MLRSRKFWKGGVGVGNFGKVGVGVGFGYFTSDSATLVAPTVAFAFLTSSGQLGLQFF